MAKWFVSIMMSLPQKIIVYIDFWHQIFNFFAVCYVFWCLIEPIRLLSFQLYCDIRLFIVRLKQGFNIGYRNQGPISVSVSESKYFFPNRKLFFFKFFSFFPTSLGNISFFKLQSKPKSEKINLKVSNFWKKIWF